MDLLTALLVVLIFVVAALVLGVATGVIPRHSRGGRTDSSQRPSVPASRSPHATPPVSVRAEPRSDVHATIARIVAETRGCKEDACTLETTLFGALGCESIDFLEVSFRIEE